jgi:FkbM family methyltransferase
MKRYAATIRGVEIQFSTEDDYSHSWFYPRYAGGRIHEKQVTEMLLDALQGAHCFVDIGTILGWFTCLASLHLPQGKVFGFEMDDLNFALLQKNLELNRCQNVVAHNMAVSDAPGVVSYQRQGTQPSPGFHMQSAGSPAAAQGTVTVSVKSIAVDDFLQAQGVVPDVMKIDVEGAEMSVLRGMLRTLRDHKPKLFLEVHPGRLPDFGTSTTEILSLLHDNGYEVFEIESLREQDANKALKPLSSTAVIENNSMLYATANGKAPVVPAR